MPSDTRRCQKDTVPTYFFFLLPSAFVGPVLAAAALLRVGLMRRSLDPSSMAPPVFAPFVVGFTVPFVSVLPFFALTGVFLPFECFAFFFFVSPSSESESPRRNASKSSTL